MSYYTLRHRFADHCGVYSITNTLSGRIYIGSTSVPFRRRWVIHLSRLRRGVHPCHLLQGDYNRDGVDTFVFDVIEMTLPAQARRQEQVWIDRMRSAGALLYNSNAAFFVTCDDPIRSDDELLAGLDGYMPEPM